MIGEVVPSWKTLLWITVTYFHCELQYAVIIHDDEREQQPLSQLACVHASWEEWLYSVILV